MADTNDSGKLIIAKQGGITTSPAQLQIMRLPSGKHPGQKVLKRAERVGLMEAEDTRHAVELVLVHNTNFYNIVQWREDGMTLNEIEGCLVFRNLHGFSMSVPLIHWFVSRANFRLPSPGDLDVESTGYGSVGPEAIIDLFAEIAERLGGSYPEHQIMHFLEEKYGGDVMAAYDAAIEDMETMVTMIQNKRDTAPRYSEQDASDIAEILKGDCSSRNPW